ncbi:MAG: threonine aldolase family protein [Thermonemataceae bacterium]
MTIDLRSDTITKPTPEMLTAMCEAEVGDDVWGDDPTVKALEAKAAEQFGVEAALFCASGTMTNQIAIRALTQPNDQVICDQLAHIYNYEGGGIASNALLSVRLVTGERGKIAPQQVVENINPDDIHFPVTRLVALENTVNKGGGNYYTIKEIEAIWEVCQQHQLKLHLDGARLFNALVETGDSPKDYGKYFDTISLCLSKGLGCPVGSVLLGTDETIKKARRIRKVMGGGWRQAGFLAAAGIYALDHHVTRLKEDHQRAKEVGKLLQATSFIKKVFPVDTNIVVGEVVEDLQIPEVVATLAAQDIKVSTFGRRYIRLVTHLHFDDEALTTLATRLKKLTLPVAS